MASQQFCLKWNNHMNNMMEVFKSMWTAETMVDVTLACDGLSLKAHKMVLSACSPFFQTLFQENPCQHPIVILKDMRYKELKAILEFMYNGEVNVAQDQLNSLMKTAETLRVKGLAENTSDNPSEPTGSRTSSPPTKRKRGRTRRRSGSASDYSDDEPKIKQSASPDIEELSSDVVKSSAKSGHFSNLQSPKVPRSSYKSSVHEPQVEEPTSADESEYGMEPAKLLEQTLTTNELNQRRGRPSQMRTPRGSTEQSLVPVSTPIATLDIDPSSPIDIKPNVDDIETIDPDMDPGTPGDDSMMYMDQSSMSSIPGTSGYQDSALVPQDSQSQDEASEQHVETIEDLKESVQDSVFDILNEIPELSQEGGQDSAFEVPINVPELPEDSPEDDQNNNAAYVERNGNDNAALQNDSGDIFMKAEDEEVAGNHRENTKTEFVEQEKTGVGKNRKRKSTRIEAKDEISNINSRRKSLRVLLKVNYQLNKSKKKRPKSKKTGQKKRKQKNSKIRRSRRNKKIILEHPTFPASHEVKTSANDDFLLTPNEKDLVLLADVKRMHSDEDVMLGKICLICDRYCSIALSCHLHHDDEQFVEMIAAAKVREEDRLQSILENAEDVHVHLRCLYKFTDPSTLEEINRNSRDFQIPVCCLCDEQQVSGTVSVMLTSKNQNELIRLSKALEDGKHLKMIDLERVIVHQSCFIRYFSGQERVEGIDEEEEEDKEAEEEGEHAAEEGEHADEEGEHADEDIDEEDEDTDNGEIHDEHIDEVEEDHEDIVNEEEEDHEDIVNEEEMQ